MTLRQRVVSLVAAMALVVMVVPGWAADSALLVVAFSDRQHVAVALRQPADYVSMPVSISSSQRDPAQRFAEMRSAKAAILKRAEGNPDIVVQSGPVTLSARPLSKLSSVTSYSGGGSEADLFVFVPFKGKNRDVFTCATMIRKFLDGILLPGRVELQLGAVQLAADNPEQYRPALLELIAQDAARTKDKLKAQGSVRLSGLESPVLVRQADADTIELFIDYQLALDIK